AIYTGIHGFLDDVPVEDVPRFQDELRERLRTEGTIYQSIRETTDLSDETSEKLNAEIEKAKEAFQPTREAAAASARSRTSSGASAPSPTRARSRAHWSWWRARSSAAPRRASRRCGRTPTACRS